MPGGYKESRYIRCAWCSDLTSLKPKDSHVLPRKASHITERKRSSLRTFLALFLPGDSVRVWLAGNTNGALPSVNNCRSIAVMYCDGSCSTRLILVPRRTREKWRSMWVASPCYILLFCPSCVSNAVFGPTLHSCFILPFIHSRSLPTLCE